MNVAGFRKVRVFTDVTEAEVDVHGNYVLLEVTNKGDTEVLFRPNHFPEQGHTSDAIPVEPGTTRRIPMTVYKFTATGQVTVVAYGA